MYKSATTPRERLIQKAVNELTYATYGQWIQREHGVSFQVFFSGGESHPVQFFDLDAEGGEREAWKMVEQLAVYGMTQDVKDYYFSTTTTAWNRLMATVLRLAREKLEDKKWWFNKLVWNGTKYPEILHANNMANEIAHVAYMNEVFAPWMVYNPQVTRQPNNYQHAGSTVYLFDI